MSRKELPRPGLVHAALAGHITNPGLSAIEQALGPTIEERRTANRTQSGALP